MEEVVKSIKAFLYDRTVSPLFGAYACAWAVWNYRVILAILDGDATLEVKRNFIDSYFGLVEYHIFGQTYQAWGQVIHGVLGPILLTLIYLFVYPFLAKPVYRYSLEKQKELREIKQEKDELRLLTHEESRNLIKEIEQLRKKSDEDINKYRERIASLTETINILESKQNSQTTSKPDDSVVNKVSKDVILDIEQLSKRLKSEIEGLPEGEFELSDLFDADEWKGLSQAARNVYGKLFKKIVDRGDFLDVRVSKKGTGNQLIYQKLETNVLTEIKKSITDTLNSGTYIASDFSEQQKNNLINKIAIYFANNHIAIEMFYFILDMINIGGSFDKSDLYELFSSQYNEIEVDHILKKLVTQGLVSFDGGYYMLSDKAKELAVESGLISLLKKIKK